MHGQLENNLRDVAHQNEMGLHITAEGVENDDQLSYLQKLHCDDIQGFLFARPMPMDDFASMLNKN